MRDILSFRKMLTPAFMQVFFWLTVVVCIVGGVYNLWHKAFVHGLQILILGPVFIRIFCEFLIVFFKIYETLLNLKITVQEKP